VHVRRTWWDKLGLIQPSTEAHGRMRPWLKWLRRTCAIGIAWVVMHIVATSVFGMWDHLGQADVIVVLGNKVHEDGTVSTRLKGRLDRARELYEAGNAPLVFVSGGLGYEGHEEAVVMRQYLLDAGVPDSAIVVDRDGYDSYRTARNAAMFMSGHGLTRALIVSQYFHIARCRLAFRSFGVVSLHHACAPVDIEIREPMALFREFLAFYYYALRRYESLPGDADRTGISQDD